MDLEDLWDNARVLITRGSCTITSGSTGRTDVGVFTDGDVTDGGTREDGAEGRMEVDEEGADGVEEDVRGVLIV